MFDELEKYKEKDHFFLRANDDINIVCNAPSKNGVFLIYSLNRGHIELVYIGCTDLTIDPPGLKNQIISRGKFLKSKIMEEGSDALDIYWYVTSSIKKIDNPKEIELKIIQRHKTVFRTIPRWNK
jgi:hypothetical protein